MDTNKPETFGAPAIVGKDATVIRLLEQAPEPQPERPRPAVQRLLQGDGANLIAFTFAPGQELPERKAAHSVFCPADAPDRNILLLTMLTGERPFPSEAAAAAPDLGP